MDWTGGLDYKTGNRAHNYYTTKPKTIKPSLNSAQYGPNGAQYSPNSAQYGPITAPSMGINLNIRHLTILSVKTPGTTILSVKSPVRSILGAVR